MEWIIIGAIIIVLFIIIISNIQVVQQSKAYVIERLGAFQSVWGVGYEFNIVALTPQEHRNLHDKKKIKVYGRDRYTWQEFETLCRNHLILHYDNWSYEGCKYHKYWKEKDYGIVARDS